MSQRLDDLADAYTTERYRLRTADRIRDEAVSAERTTRLSLQGYMLANGIQQIETEEAVYTIVYRMAASLTTYPVLTSRERRNDIQTGNERPKT